MTLRLGHLLPPAEPPATSARRSGTTGVGTDMPARLAALEDEGAILTARLADLLALIDDMREGHRDRLLRTAASPVAQRR